MESTRSSRRTDGSTFDIDSSPITLQLPRGSAVFAVRGEAWITQEGRHEDIVLAAGDRFDVAGGRPIVASATHGRALLHVVRPVGVCRGAALDLYDFARCRAQDLRRAELSRLGRSVFAAVRRWASGAAAALAGRTGLSTH